MLWKYVYFAGIVLVLWTHLECHPRVDLEPEFIGIAENVTVAEGKEALLSCVVENLGFYRVAWIRVESQTILTIHTHVITRNYRITLQHKDHQHWNLHVSNVQESDKGQYMCQINTVPMKKNIVYLDVLVPPKFLDRGENFEVLAREGTNVTLTCRVKGHPKPTVTWKREDGRHLGSSQINKAQDQDFSITKVSRLHMGKYLCSASNTVAPPVTRGIMLQVLFPPMIWIPNQLTFASLGDTVSLDCYTEAFPMSINYWTKADSCMIVPDDKYIVTLMDSVYKVSMKLMIADVQQEDFGSYKCIARNSLGSSEGVIRLYETSRPSNAKKIHFKERNEVGRTNSEFKGNFEEGIRNKDASYKLLHDTNAKERAMPKSALLGSKHLSGFMSSTASVSSQKSLPAEVVLSLIATWLVQRLLSWCC